MDRPLPKTIDIFVCDINVKGVILAKRFLTKPCTHIGRALVPSFLGPRMERLGPGSPVWRGKRLHFLTRALLWSPSNEIPFLLDKQDTDPILLPDGSSLNCLLYADDLVLISSSASGLQNALSTLSQFCRDWRMNINTKKTKAIIFQKKHRKSTLLKHKFLLIEKTLKSPIIILI